MVIWYLWGQLFWRWEFRRRRCHRFQWQEPRARGAGTSGRRSLEWWTASPLAFACWRQVRIRRYSNQFHWNLAHCLALQSLWMFLVTWFRFWRWNLGHDVEVIGVGGDFVHHSEQVEEHAMCNFRVFVVVVAVIDGQSSQVESLRVFVPQRDVFWGNKNQA